MLNDELLKSYVKGFYGFGRWDAPIWFVGIEEAGGWTQQHVEARLNAWSRNRARPLPLENAPSFYPASGISIWHGDFGLPQHTWSSLIQLLMTVGGESPTAEKILGPRKFFSVKVADDFF